MSKAQAAKRKTTTTRVPPVFRNKEFDATAQQIGQDREAMIALEGPAEIDKDDIETVPGPRLGDKAEQEAFMADMLKILVYPSTEQYPEDPIQLGVNGRQCFVFRNKPTMLKRCYVAQLAKAKTEAITQDPTSEIPEIANKLHLSSTLRYPFSVLEDPAGAKGQAWLQKVLAEV